MFANRWLTNSGPLLQQFEAELEAITGAKHCVALCNGTVALELAVRAADLTGEVIVPSFTFVATVHALRASGLTPVFCDIDPSTHNIDPGAAARLVTTRTSAILGVHLWGRTCDVDTLAALAEAYDLTLLFDAAHAFGCSYRGRPVGTLGDAEVFSFHATKFVNSFEGGAVATEDDALAARIRQLANFGYSPDDEVVALGTNGKMTEICAAMGLTSLRSMDAIVATNRRHYGTYAALLADLRGLALIDYDPTEACNYQYIVVDVGPEAALTRDELVAVLRAENVLARRYFSPGVHRMEPYRTEQPDAGRALPVTERLAARLLTLPTGTAIDEVDVRMVCGIIRRALDAAPAVRAALGPLRVTGR
jgi:dTDP-4-amino-4,6-dideoxygalactose transaminase